AGLRTDFNKLPFRYTLYCLMPEASVDAFQERLIWLQLAAVATTLAGTVGGVLSGLAAWTEKGSQIETKTAIIGVNRRAIPARTAVARSGLQQNFIRPKNNSFVTSNPGELRLGI